MLAAVYFKSLPGGEVYPLVPEKIQKFPLYVADAVFQLYLTSLSGQSVILSFPRLIQHHCNVTIWVALSGAALAARRAYAFADKPRQSKNGVSFSGA